MIKKYGVFLIVFAAILWSFDGLLRRSLYVLPPAIIVFYEHLLGFVLLLPFAYPHLNELKKLNRKDWSAFIWIALLSGVLGTLLYTAALGKINFIDFSVVVLLQKLQPLFVVGAAHFLLKEKITKEYIKWGLVALVGAYFVSFPTLLINFNRDANTIIAALFAVGAAFCWGSSTAFSRFTLLRYHFMLSTAIRFAFTIPLALLFVILTRTAPSLNAVSPSQWMTLLIISLSTGTVALVIYYKGLSHTEAKVSALAELAWPLSALVIGYVYFHERLTITQFLGAGILLLSMYKVVKLQKTHV